MPKKFEVGYGPIFSVEELQFFVKTLEALNEKFPTTDSDEPAAQSDGVVSYYLGEIPVFSDDQQVAVISDEFSHGWTIQFGTETEA